MLVSKKFSKIIILMCIFTIVFCTIGTAKEEVREMTIRAAWGETLDPWSHSQSAMHNILKFRAEEMSHGKMKVELLPADSVGTAPQRLDLLARNSIQVTSSMPSGIIGSKYLPVMDYLY